MSYCFLICVRRRRTRRAGSAEKARMASRERGVPSASSAGHPLAAAASSAGGFSLPFELMIALRYLAAKRKQAFISIISAISVLGVVVGVMALMVALGLMTGLQKEIRSKILGTTAHI